MPQIVPNDSFYTVFGWMQNVLELKGSELTIFAIIYGFSHDGKSEYEGSISYLREFANIKSDQTVYAALKSLDETRHYIVKRPYMQGNVKRVAYRANLPLIAQLRGEGSNN